MFKPNARLLSRILLLAFALVAWLIAARDASPRAHAQSPRSTPHSSRKTSIRSTR
ncbi:MAG: hypothetical protein HZC40_25325 [Chloroflexi bacterium]|nr:hypothetical protein [Chloroflexota bacterium]